MKRQTRINKNTLLGWADLFSKCFLFSVPENTDLSAISIQLDSFSKIELHDHLFIVIALNIHSNNHLFNQHLKQVSKILKNIFIGFKPSAVELN